MSFLLPVLLAASLVAAGDRVALIGDSEAFLLAHEMPALARTAGVKFKAFPAPGSSVITWTGSLPAQWASLAAFRPQVVLVSLGANDACVGASFVRWEAPLVRQLVRRLGALGARQVVWLMPPRIGSSTVLARARAGQEALAEVLQAQQVVWLDARSQRVDMWPDLLHCSRPQYAGDPAHGCRDWAQWVWQVLQDPSQVRP